MNTLAFLIFTFASLAQTPLQTPDISYEQSNCKILKGAPRSYVLSGDPVVNEEKCFMDMAITILRFAKDRNHQITRDHKGSIQYLSKEAPVICVFIAKENHELPAFTLSHLAAIRPWSSLTASKIEPYYLKLKSELLDLVEFDCEFLGM